MYIHSREACAWKVKPYHRAFPTGQNIVPKILSLMGWLVMLIRYQCANCTLAARALGCTCSASDQRAPYIPFSQYDATGRRKYCHVTGVFVKHPNATPVIHQFDWAPGQVGLLSSQINGRPFVQEKLRNAPK